MYYCQVPGNVLINNLYCKTYPIHNIEKGEDKIKPGIVLQNGFTILPTPIPNSYERIEVDGMYLIDNSEYIYLYVLKEVD